MRRQAWRPAVRKTKRERSRVEKERRSLLKLEVYRARLQRCAKFIKSFLRRSQVQLRTQNAYIQSARRIHSISYQIGHFFRFIALRLVAHGMSPQTATMPNRTVNQADKLMDTAKVISTNATTIVQKIHGSVEQLTRVEKEFDKALCHMKSAFRNRHFYVWRMHQVYQLRTAYKDSVKRVEASTGKLEAEAESFYRGLTEQLGKVNILRIVPDLASWLQDP